MPETFGKRMRGAAKAKKAADRDERRVARNRRRDARAAGLLERGPELGEPFDPTSLDDEPFVPRSQETSEERPRPDRA
jgi:hypothetical protein